MALIGLLIYNFFIKKPEKGNGSGSGGLPQGEEGEFIPEEEGFVPDPELKVKVISTDPVLSPVLTKDKSNVIYYHTNGEVWQSNFDGSELTQVSDAVLDDLVKIIWSPDKDKVISIFEDSAGNVAKYSYSYTTGKAVPLDTYINYITWSPDNTIAYQYQNDISDVINISTANPDESGYIEVLITRMKN